MINELFLNFYWFLQFSEGFSKKVYQSWVLKIFSAACYRFSCNSEETKWWSDWFGHNLRLEAIKQLILSKYKFRSEEVMKRLLSFFYIHVHVYIHVHAHVSFLKAFMSVDAMPSSPWCCGRSPGQARRPCHPRLPRRSSCFQAGLVFRPTGFLTIPAGAAENSPRNRFFSYPEGRFLHTPGWQLLRSLHKGGTYSANGNLQWGSTSELVRSSSKASTQGGSPVEAAYAPGSWPDSTATTLYSSTIVHCVQSLYISHYIR